MTNKILQNELVEELYTRITAHKLDVVGKKIQAYYEAFQGVEIPEFMKPKEEQIKEKVKLHLLQLLKSGQLDYFYQKAMEDEESEV